MSTCRSCGAPIRWVKTAKGRSMPIDSEPVANGNVIIDSSGNAVVVGSANVIPDTDRFTSHFTTCPQADEWRHRMVEIRTVPFHEVGAS